MGFRVVEVTCPGCGAPWATDQRMCEYCGRAVVISSLSDLSGLTASEMKRASKSLGDAVDAGADDPIIELALGAVYLKLDQYDRAAKHFGKVIDAAPGESEAYFYAAIAELGGKKPFLSTLAKIRSIESHVNTAMQIEARGPYWALLGYVVQDYYERKGLASRASSAQCVNEARNAGLSSSDIDSLIELLKAGSADFFMTLR